MGKSLIFDLQLLTILGVPNNTQHRASLQSEKVDTKQAAINETIDLIPKWPLRSVYSCNTQSLQNVIPSNNDIGKP